MTWFGIVWEADCRSGTYRTIETLTDSTGSYRLSVPQGQGSLWVETSDRIGQTREALFLEETPHDDTHQDYTFRIFHIDGRVLGPGGTPLARGKVTYYPDPGGMAICGTGLPEAPIIDGRFTALVRLPGRYVFGLAPDPQDAGISSISQIVPIRADTTITFSLDGPVIEGTVRDGAGRPLVGAKVEARGHRVGNMSLTDSLGWYRLCLPRASYRWTVSPMERWIQPRGYDWDSVATARRRDFEIAGSVWSGQVRNAVTGEPIDSIDIYGFSGGMNSAVFGDGIFCMSGPNGRFRFVVRPGVRFDVSLRDHRLTGVVHRAGGGKRANGQRIMFDHEAERERIEREYSRVKGRVIAGVVAGGDSTFDFILDPISK